MSDMWLPPGEDPRDEDHQPRGERETLEQYLRRYRRTLAMKCEGLDAEQLARRSVPPSTMSLIGLVRHLAKVEHTWTKRVLQGRMDLPRLYHRDGHPDWDYDGAGGDAECVEEAWAAWHREVADADAWMRGEDLDRLVVDDEDNPGEPFEVRDVVVHLIEEYARHVGHADLLRECLDGRTGQ